jgi:ketosteroid isomerase-like protein
MTSIEPDVTALLERQSDAIRQKDIERLMSCFAADIVYYDTVPPLQYAGTAALRARFLEWFGGFAGPIDLELRDLHVLGSSEFAVAYRLSRARGTLKNGREVGSWVRATSACGRSDGRWLVTHEHVSFAVDLQRGSVAMDLVP